MDPVSMNVLGVVAGLLIIGVLSFCYSIRETSEELSRLVEAVQKFIDITRNRFDEITGRMKELEDRVERLEGLLSKPLTRTERFLQEAMENCAKEDE